MVVRCSVHLHGEAADAAGNVVTRCSVHEPLTYEALRAVYPFAGRFHFRVRRKLEGEDVWYDIREGEAIELDDPKRCDVRALCVDYDDDRWDGPAARGAADDDDDDPLVAAARDSVDAVRRAARAAAASDAGRRATAAVSSAASAMRARAGKLSSWLSKNDADPSDY